MHRLLEFIAHNDIKNLIFLSGDEHVSNVTTIDLSSSSSSNSTPNKPIKTTTIKEATNTRIYSIHSSGLYSPYPFANSSPDDFAEKETFDIGKDNLQCKVASTFYPGDGYALTSVYQQEETWHISSDFSRAGDSPESTENIASWSTKL